MPASSKDDLNPPVCIISEFIFDTGKLRLSCDISERLYDSNFITLSTDIVKKADGTFIPNTEKIPLSTFKIVTTTENNLDWSGTITLEFSSAPALDSEYELKNTQLFIEDKAGNDFIFEITDLMKAEIEKYYFRTS